MSTDPKAHSRERFSQYAQNYVTSTGHAKGSELDRLLEIAAPRADWLALDVATGGGHTALKFAPRVRRIIVTDYAPAMLDTARRFITQQGADNAAFVPADAENLPFAPSTFDLITCRIAPHHFPDVARFVRECARTVRPGGLVGVVDQLAPPDPQTARYVNAFERLRDPSHVWAYNRAEWRGFFSAAGLEVVHYEEFDKEQALVAWAELMGCDGPTITRLRALLAQAPQPAAAWLRPQSPASADARFSIRQFLLVGRRAG